MYNIYVFNTVIIELFFIFVFVFLLTWYLYYRSCFTYWKKKGLPTPSPVFPAGNILTSVLGKESLYIAISNYYKEFKSKGHRHAGLYFFNGPVYLPIDPEIVKLILTTDFEHFVDRGVFVDEENYPLSAHIFALEGSRWKKLRQRLSPAFSSGKLKAMYEIFMAKTHNFVNTLEPIAQKGKETNIKHVATNFTADLIFSTVFGVETDTLKNPDSHLAKMAINVFNPPTWLFIKSVFLTGFQNPGNMLRPVFGNKIYEKFFSDFVQSVMKLREDNNIVRKDFLSLLLDIKAREGLTFNEIAAQCFLFILAGFETASQTISYCIHELAHNQDLQDKLRSEIFEKLGEDYRTFTYEGVSNLTYLDNIMHETLRLYPVLGFFHRICVKNYKIPGTDVVIEENTPVLIPVLGLQRDPEYFPEPLKFDPRRFQEGHSLVPFTFLPFSDGPRFCIGRLYGKLQFKLGIAALISQFRFFPSPQTPKFIEFDKFSKSMAMIPVKGLTVKVQKL